MLVYFAMKIIPPLDQMTPGGEDDIDVYVMLLKTKTNLKQPYLLSSIIAGIVTGGLLVITMAASHQWKGLGRCSLQLLPMYQRS